MNAIGQYYEEEIIPPLKELINLQKQYIELLQPNVLVDEKDLIKCLEFKERIEILEQRINAV